jgi:hypothetical protein
VRPTYSTTLHLSLASIGTSLPLTLHAMGREYAIRAHPTQTLCQSRQDDRVWSAIPESQMKSLTHFAVDVELPQDSVGFYYATQPPSDPESLMGDMVATAIHVPLESRKIAARRRMRLGDTLEVPHQLQLLGVEASILAAANSDPLKLLAASSVILSPLQTAKSILFQHPEIASLNPEIAADMLDYYIEDALKRHPDLW